MIRNLKVLGLALVAVFAMSAVAASAASADALTAESYPATVTGAHDPAGGAVDTFTTTAGTVKCPGATYHGTLSAAKTELTITPSFNGPLDNCSSLAGAVPTIVHTNGCDLLFHVGAGALTTGTVDIVCPAGQELTITSNQNTAGTLTSKCIIHVPPQVGINGITYDNIGAGTTREIRVTINSNNIKYTHTAGTGLGACTTGVQQNNGSFTGQDLLTGETDPTGANHIGLFLTESAV